MTNIDDARDFQRKCADFVEREVILRQTNTIEKIQKADDSWMDSCINLDYPTCPHCSSNELEKDVKDNDEICWKYKCECGEFFDEPDFEGKEIYEWWAVTEYLAEKLNKRGECIFDGPDCKIWGRATTGQAILLDGVIEQIVKELNGL